MVYDPGLVSLVFEGGFGDLLKFGEIMKEFQTRGHPIKAWIDGVFFEAGAKAQLENIAQMPFIFRHVAAMPDVHVGIGATVGSVIATKGAIIPAAVGVDIGCGMVAQRTSLRAGDLPDSLTRIRGAIERAVPVGFAGYKETPQVANEAWATLERRFHEIMAKFPALDNQRALKQLGTLGQGNHFIELCLDEHGFVWLMLHSGSRGIGNRIGSFFIERAKTNAEKVGVALPDRNLAYFDDGSEDFANYIEAVGWAQDYARVNRDVMVHRILDVLCDEKQGLPAFTLTESAVNCHHNYVARETHFGESVYVTRKGAVRAGEGELGIIPGSMGAKSFIVRGRGNAESFESCSHGAGRRLGRTEARKQLTLKDLKRETEGVECRKDAGVLDEAPSAYKPIDDVMRAQRDLVAIVHTLKQVLCVKG